MATEVDLAAQYRLLQQQLAQTGGIARGSTFRRYYTLQVAGKPKRCGPYYSLTRKQDQKTLTHALTAEQYRLFSKAIACHRRLESVLKKMRKLSLRFILQSTPGLPRRNRLS